MKSHYETLGVSPKATVDEIKAAYRKLCMETHPDVASSGCDKRFKQISEAHQILSNPKERRLYDLGQSTHYEWRRRPPPRSGAGASHQHSHHSIFVNSFFRPRNMFMGMALGYCTVSLFQSVFSTTTRGKQNHLVEAWKNPKTNQWEPPAPWDETYQRAKPKLVMMPREQVRPRH